MIEWIKEKFTSLICFCFVVFVILDTIGGGIIGYLIGRGNGIGIVLGLIIGIAIGIILGILVFGLLATIINISENTDYILIKIDNLLKDKHNEN